eukprot:CAMPEP_0197620158 /NCGR_PEP_ID=MMETSP1338-20131121/1025_1 /TAXON_ID=43686 ORGANISM="Pelagodinium beii, Strain RCC1491" /NCGR_SAMPLE_ID=MMETSP1338 /ASSEMBLY_ACC=CAM_ASM_000754 /LENGTH=110 /DNA_ID=CAMNT_0043189253 /DNA_START=103 /DNA_END=432 /DNA_ORIENTATION=+
MSCAAAEGQALRGSSSAPTEVSNATSAPSREDFNETASATSTEDFNATAGAPDASLENLEALGLTNFAVSSSGCNIKCVYADWARGTCHGTTCVCSGLKSSQPQYLPNTC